MPAIQARKDSTPTIVKGAAAGSGDVALETGSTDQAGSVVSVTPNADDTTGTLCTITFGVPYRNTPLVALLTPKGAVTSRVYVVSISKTTLVVGQNVDLAGGNQDFSYAVIAPSEG